MDKIKTEDSFESRFESIFNHVNEGILIANRDGNIVLNNPKLSQLFDYGADDLKGRPVENLIPVALRKNHISHREGYMNKPTPRPMGKNMVLFGQKKSGAQFPVEISLSYYETEGSLYVIAFVIDISERFMQQQKIEGINDELKQLNENLERKVGERTLVLREALDSLEKSRDELTIALEKEKELNEMKSRFISMASHEFRTPLSAVLSSISLIGKYNKEEEQPKREKHIDRIKSAVHNLTDILNDILSLGKLEEGVIRANMVVCDLAHCIEEVVAELSAITKPGQQIRATHSGKNEIVADKQLLRNIIINLVSNAIKFSSEDAAIVVKSAVNMHGATVVVKDNGLGISEDDQRHLFERFYRGKNATNIQGTGLGLSIVLKYLELMDGTIECKSELEHGSEFIIFIPFHIINQQQA
ncbi:MAG: PAS domain-containing sensor histidine kinase [Flavobacteriales bacterium]|nr:PAS domain-containing sensor histidine kinase [Flavobacteriales bacterium]